MFGKKHNSTGKIVFNKFTIGWSSFNFDDSFLHLLDKNQIEYIALSPLKENNINYEFHEKIDLKEIYKNIQLYDVSIYSICNELQIFKNELCVKKHSNIIKKWFITAKQTIDYILSVFDVNNINGAIIFHGHLLFDACLLALCKINGIKFITFESTSNKERVVWDNVSGFVVTYNLAKAFFKKNFNTLNKTVVEEYSNNYIKNIHSFKRPEHLTINRLRTLPFKENYVIFLCQVYNDASMLFAINEGFKNPVDVIKETYSILKTKGYNLIIKLHPKEISGKDPVCFNSYNKPTLSRLEELKDCQDIFIDINNDYDTFELIDHAKVVVTVNSQAGMEACLLNKPVLNYCNCFYSELDFSYDYDNAKTLKFQLEYLLEIDKPVAKNLFAAKAFFYIFYEIYCIKRSHITAYNKILEVFGMFNKYGKRNWLLFRISKKF